MNADPLRGSWRQVSRGGAEPAPARTEWVFGPFRLLSCGTLLTGTRAVPLTPKEEGVLRSLVEAEGRRLSKDEIVGRVWGAQAASDASLTRAVHTLRLKLRESGGPADYVRTVYGRGYQLTVPVRRLESR